MTALLTTYIHQIQPENITVSIGGEIGHIGGKNSTAQDFEAFMELYQQQIKIGALLRSVSRQEQVMAVSPS